MTRPLQKPLSIALLAGGIALIDGFDSQLIAFATPVMAPAFGTTAPQFGPVITAGMVGSLLSVFLQAPLSDRLGRKAVVLLSLLLMGLATVATVFAQSVAHLVALRFLAGLGIGAALPNLLGITGDHAPAERRFLFVTAVFTGVPLGAVVGGSAAAWLLATQGWPSLFWLGGLLALVALPAAAIGLPESRTPVATAGQRVSIAHLFTDGRRTGTLLLWSISFLSLLVSIFIVNWLPTILNEGGVTISSAVIGSVVLQGGGIVGSLIISGLIDRYGSLPMILAYLVGALALAALALLPLAGVATLAMLFVAGIFFIGAQMCIASLSTFQYPSELRASGIGWAIGFGRIGGIVGTVTGGILLARQVSAAELFVIAAIIVVVVAGALTLLSRHVRRPAASAPERSVLAVAEQA